MLTVAAIAVLAAIAGPFAVARAMPAAASADPSGVGTSVGASVCVRTDNSAPFSAGTALRDCSSGALAPPDAPTTPISTDAAAIPGWGAPSWRDEFDEAAIDPTKWNVRSRADLGLLNDTAVPDASMVSASDGIAHIRAEWLTTPEARNGGQGILTHRTGYMDQLGRNPGNVRVAQKYGRWEVRVKVPTGPNTLGALSAFWLRNDKSGEIDVMESWGFGAAPGPNGQRDGTSTTTVHNLTNGGAGYSKYAWTLEEELRKKGVVVPKVYTRFVTVAFEYTPEYAATIYDGVEVFRATPQTHPMLWDARYFDSPLHVRLNLHVGPSTEYYGIPDPARRDLTQPLDYQIDYVRIWSMP